MGSSKGTPGRSAKKRKHGLRPSAEARERRKQLAGHERRRTTDAGDWQGVDGRPSSRCSRTSLGCTDPRHGGIQHHQEDQLRRTTILIVEQNVKQTLLVANRGYVLETGKIPSRGRDSPCLTTNTQDRLPGCLNPCPHAVGPPRPRPLTLHSRVATGPVWSSPNPAWRFFGWDGIGAWNCKNGLKAVRPLANQP